MKDVAHSTWFGGVYQDPKNFFPQFVIEPEQWRQMYPEFEVDRRRSGRTSWPTARASWSARKLAQRFGWKIGDHVPLKAPGYLGGGSWDFNVRAIYHGTRPQDDEGQLWLQHKYFYEKAPALLAQGIVGWYIVRVASPDEALRVAKAIDAGVRATPPPRRAPRPSPPSPPSFMKQMGNIEFLILAIGSVVFFTLLLVTGNTMAIAVRERTGELAVLKAVGYSDRFVLGLVLAESLLIAAVGGGDRPLARPRPRGAGHHERASCSMYLPGSALVAGRRGRRSAPASSPASCPRSPPCA